jgi:hypothetical protein
LGNAGVHVAATSTTVGADLLVSGVAEHNSAQIRKYNLFRPSADATMLEAKQIGTVTAAAGSVPNVLGGD